MNSYYNNILVPIEDPRKVQKAVDRAMLLATPCRSIIHLAHLIPTWNPFARLGPATAYKVGSKEALESYIKALLNLTQWKDLIEENEHISQVKIHIMRGPSMNAFIQELTQRTQIDLIIFANDKTRKWLSGIRPVSGNKIARETQCAVLSINSKKNRRIKQEVEMLSEPLSPPYDKKVSPITSRFGLTGVYDLLSSN